MKINSLSSLFTLSLSPETADCQVHRQSPSSIQNTNSSFLLDRVVYNLSRFRKYRCAPGAKRIQLLIENNYDRSNYTYFLIFLRVLLREYVDKREARGSARITPNNSEMDTKSCNKRRRILSLCQSEMTVYKEIIYSPNRKKYDLRQTCLSLSTAVQL